MNNQLSLIGYVGQKPEAATSDKGDQVVRFSLAVGSPYGKEESAEKVMWVDCEAVSDYSKRLVETVSEGCEVAVSGRLTVANFTSVDGDGMTVRGTKPVLKLSSLYNCTPVKETKKTTRVTKAKKAHS